VSRFPIRRELKLAIGIFIAVASLAWAFSDVDGAALVRALRSARVLWLVAAVVSVFLSVACIVWRWWCLLNRPVSGPGAQPPWLVMWNATIAAHIANIIVPFRLGDSVRILAASQRLGLGPARAASAAVIERIADVAALGVIGGALVFTSAVPAWAQAAVVSKSKVALAIVVMAVVTVVIAGWIGARRITVLPSRSAMWWAALGTAAVPATSVLTNYLVVRAFDLPLPISASVLLLVVLQAGTSVIAVPGGLGVSQVLTLKTLEIWHVPVTEALAFSIVLYAVSRLPKLLFLPFAMAAGRDAMKPAADRGVAEP
jgi:uncharacterized membrane protein YbhN (UPF0104 family)